MTGRDPSGPGGGHIIIQADMGQPVYHVGDEAMAQAAVWRLRGLGFSDLTLLSRGDSRSEQTYGDQTRFAPTPQFPWPPVDRERYLDEIRQVLAGRTDALPPHDQVFALIELFRQGDALLISGGGNLNSQYGWLLYERAACALIARHFGLPVVISGQTIGPELSQPDRRVLAELLESAQLVCLREASSYALARQLCPHHQGLVAGLDDAFVLPPPTVEPEGPPGGLIATLSPVESGLDPDRAAAAYARLIDQVADLTSSTVRLVPQMATWDQADIDQDMHRRVAAQMRHPVEQRPLESALTAAAITQRAAWIITTRYHPVVFGLAGGARVMALSGGPYSSTRLDGALAHWGLRQASLPVSSLLRAAQRPTLWPLVRSWADYLSGPGQPSGQGRMDEVSDFLDRWWAAVGQVLPDQPV
jgi:hypothetical protein